ncbi:hypothetical protein ACO0RG_001512 [Hanseniaspora osmophila]|uniref:thioredoxin-dependent peroxiredoxin n=1 Tax=Hanseniaspora osmophila TaxID=56408 RepID=A0A1E5R0V9_9ASCO|nr:Peroxiredoxin DOT5 [Hanseniaspora osmophila]
MSEARKSERLANLKKPNSGHPEYENQSIRNPAVNEQSITHNTDSNKENGANTASTSGPAHKKIKVNDEHLKEKVAETDFEAQKKSELSRDETKDRKTQESKEAAKDEPSEEIQKTAPKIDSLEIPDDLELQLENEKTVNVKKDVINDGKLKLIFAYPKACTSGCTKQAQGFKKIYNELEKTYEGRVEIYGLSADKPAENLKFKQELDLPFHLLSDPERKLIHLLKASNKDNTKTVRSHFVWDNNGKLIHENIQVSPDDSIEKGENQLTNFLRT